jgi:hypothetical protein
MRKQAWPLMTSASPKCMTASPSLKSLPLKIWASSLWQVQSCRGRVTARDGARPINTSGGLKSKGPGRRIGVAQVIEIFKQMRCEAGARQVQGDLALAVTHNVGATGSTCVVHVYERRS